ncbi:MAG: hypothetical protein ACLFQV_01780 [Vulcanimicrobiota bacterium]
MNTIGPGGMNMTQFAKRAMRVAAQQAGTVKDKKETGKTDDTKDLQDSISLSDKAQLEKAQSKLAQGSADASQLAKKEKQKDKGDAGKVSMFGGEDEAYTKKQAEGAGAKDSQPKTEMEEVSPKDNARIQKALNRSPEEIMGDIPENFATAARKIVQGKIQKNQPNQELSQLKEVPETADMAFDLAKPVDIMPIHDTRNDPIPMKMEGANVSV